VALPEELWTTVLQASPSVVANPQFQLTAYTAQGGRLNTTYLLPYTMQPAVATFKFTGVLIRVKFGDMGEDIGVGGVGGGGG